MLLSTWTGGVGVKWFCLCCPQIFTVFQQTQWHAGWVELANGFHGDRSHGHPHIKKSPPAPGPGLLPLPLESQWKPPPLRLPPAHLLLQRWRSWARRIGGIEWRSVYWPSREEWGREAAPTGRRGRRRERSTGKREGGGSVSGPFAAIAVSDSGRMAMLETVACPGSGWGHMFRRRERPWSEASPRRKFEKPNRTDSLSSVGEP